MMNLSVIIPAYNEGTTITSIIDKVQAVVLPEGVTKEIVVVNDGSTDNTAQALEVYRGQSGITVVTQENKGKTGALLTGITHARGDVFIIQDADLEYDPIFYPQLLTPIIKGETQVVYGSRFLGSVRDMAIINRVANLISNHTVNILYGTQITDINTCYKTFTRRALEGITITGSHFDMDAEMTVKFLLKGLSIKEIPIAYAARSRGAGKKIKWGTALHLYWQIIKYRFS